MAIVKDITWAQALRYSFFQIIGGITGALISHLMFYDTIPKIFEFSTVSRSGGAYFSEVNGAFILVVCILSLVHQKSQRVSQVVGLLVSGMLLSTSSTMFANPQVIIARIFTYSAAGIRPVDGLIFICMQIIGMVFAVIVWKYGIMKCSCAVR